MKRPTLAQYQSVEVLWLDPTTVPGWHELYRGQCCRARGIVIEHSDDVVVLAMLDNEADQVSETFSIPKGQIVGMWELKRGKRLI